MANKEATVADLSDTVREFELPYCLLSTAVSLCRS